MSEHDIACGQDQVGVWVAWDRSRFGIDGPKERIGHPHGQNREVVLRYYAQMHNLRTWDS